MTDGDRSDDRGLLTVTAWRHEGELVGIVRRRASMAEDTEVVTSAHGLEALVALVTEQLRSLADATR
jgi:hypothetical protein